MPWTCYQLHVDVLFLRLAAETWSHQFQVSCEVKSTMHNSVLNPMLIPPANFVGLELTANVAQSMELSSSYFETAEFCDLSVVVELGEL